MDVSVIMPVRNGAALVRATAKSVLEQPGIEVELVAVDDASLDGGADVLRGLNDSRVRLISLREHGGVSRARNEGMAHAGGEYLAFADAGDLLAPGALAVLLSAAREHGADVVAGGYSLDITDDLVRFGADGEPPFTDNRLELSAPTAACGGEGMADLVASLLDNDLFHPVGNKFYRRAALEGVRFDETVFCLLEDELFNLDAFVRIRRAAVLPERIFFAAAQGGNSLSRRFDDDRLFNLMKLRRGYDRLLAALACGDDAPLRKNLSRQLLHHCVGLLATLRRAAEWADPVCLMLVIRRLLEPGPFRAAAAELGLDRDFFVSVMNTAVDRILPELRRRALPMQEHDDWVQNLGDCLSAVKVWNPEGAEKAAALAKKNGAGAGDADLLAHELWSSRHG